MVEPCPFCGNPVKTDFREYDAWLYTCYAHIVCDECGVEMHSVGDSIDKVIHEVLQRWNRRHKRTRYTGYTVRYDYEHGCVKEYPYAN